MAAEKDQQRVSHPTHCFVSAPMAIYVPICYTFYLFTFCLYDTDNLQA